VSTIELLRLPQPHEFEAALAAIRPGSHKVNLVEMEIAAVAQRGTHEAGVHAELSPEQAWRLTMVARDLHAEAEQLRAWAEEIERNVEFVWNEMRGSSDAS
jgi:hypothetical protein